MYGCALTFANTKLTNAHIMQYYTEFLLIYFKHKHPILCIYLVNMKGCNIRIKNS